MVAVATGALVAGCVSLPDHSSVSSGRGAGLPRQQSAIRNSPPGPVPGASRAEVVDGYLAAMLAYPRRPDLVREFMTPRAAFGWRPNGRLQVYESESVVPKKAGVELNANILGSLDARGSWTSATHANAAVSTMLALTKVEGEWRIANPPDGGLIDTDTFTRYYKGYSLYFFDSKFAVLGPDPVYLALRSTSATATDLVRNLLLGPTISMAGVVSTAVPTHTTLDPGVTVSKLGVADVRLSRNVAALSPAILHFLAGQIAWTLRQVPGVLEIRLTAGGRVLSVQGLGTVFRVESFRSYGPPNTPASRTLFAVSKTGLLYTISDEGAVRVTGPVGSAVGEARSVAVDSSGEHAALVSSSGTSVFEGSLTETQSDTPPKLWLKGATNLLPPSWDAAGLLWTVDLTKAGAVLRVTTGSGSKIIEAPGFSGQQITAFAVSGDGMRLAAVLGSGERSRLIVAMIKRDPRSLTNVSLVDPLFIENSDFPLSNLAGIAWVNSTTVAVLAHDQSSVAQPYLVAVDGSRVVPVPGFLPKAPVSIASGPGARKPMVVGAADGSIYIRTTEQQWSPLAPKTPLFSPAYPG